jgi:glycerol kinase
MQVIMALDQGTTSSRAILFDRSGQIVGMAGQELTQHYPQPGWVEHDASEIWSSQLSVARQVLRDAGMDASNVAGLGITNQRETTMIWDRTTGRPLHRAIVWQDRRTAAECDAMIAAGHGEKIAEKTGLVIDPYFFGTKLAWLLDNVPDARNRAERGEVAAGTIDSWLLWNLTGGKLHATDATNASRTLLMDIHSMAWDPSLLDLFNVPQSVLPEIHPSSSIFEQTVPDLFGGAIPIGGAAGDQQAALFGQNCCEMGMAKNTYGTGCFMLMNVGNQPTRSQCKLLTTVACAGDQHPWYAMEGSIFIAGAAVQWLRDGLGIIDSSAEVEALAASVPDSGGVYLVPAFAGLGAPHWDPRARGTICGITRGTSRAHIARATLEGIAFQVADCLDAMRQDAGDHLTELRVDGGAAANDLLMQFQADLIQVPVVRPQTVETTALGAAFLAGLSTGFWSGIDQIQSIWHAERIFEPRMSREDAEDRRSKWNDALSRSKNWEGRG